MGRGHLGLAPLTLEPFGRLVVVSPHPDDETLGCGGLVATTAETAVPVVVLVVTDGELAGPQKNLAEIRRGELHAALTALCGLERVTVHFLERPDGRVAGHLEFVRSAVADVIGRGDLVVCPLIDDGHPDHEAVSRATTIAARQTAARLLTFPVWAWHCHDPKSSRTVADADSTSANPPDDASAPPSSNTCPSSEAKTPSFRPGCCRDWTGPSRCTSSRMRLHSEVIGRGEVDPVCQQG